MSSRKRHVGNREDPPTGKCLGVFGLSLYTNEREVKDMFERYGRVADCRIVHDHATGRSRGFAFVNMESVGGAEDAKERLNGAELDGRRIRVDYSITQRAHTPTPGVYMGRPTSKGGREGREGGGGGGGRYRGSGGRNSGGGGSGSGSRYGYRRSYSRSRSRSRSPYYR
jgi:transformer-2 protein